LTLIEAKDAYTEESLEEKRRLFVVKKVEKKILKTLLSPFNLKVKKKECFYHF